MSSEAGRREGPGARTLKARIDARELTVGVVGLGYVGLGIAAALVRAGFDVLGLDLDADRVGRLNDGITDMPHLGADLAADLRATGRFAASAELDRMGGCGAVLICVPTPLDERREPDLSAVAGTAERLGRVLGAGGADDPRLVVLESTTWPGTTREVLLPALESGGRRLGVDLFVAFSPEREDPGRRDFTTANTPRLVGGLDEASRDVAAHLYRAAVSEVVPVSSAEVAEAAKLLENIYRAVNIAMVNEMKTLLTGLGIDIWEVIDAASTKPFGFQPFRPGPGLGGHCIPIDPFYMAWKARQAGLPARFIALAGEVNHAMPAWVVQRTRAALEARGTDVRGARLLVLGLAYKPDVADVRESPSFALIDQLTELGAQVDYQDPHVPRTAPQWRPGKPELVSADAVLHDDAALAAYDAVILATNHSAYDYARLARVARLVVDTRGALRGLDGTGGVRAAGDGGFDGGSGGGPDGGRDNVVPA